MLKTRLLSIAVLAISIVGCTTKAPASCDGSQRRPINAPAHASIVYQSCGAGVV